MDSRFDIKIEADYINANNDLQVYESDIDHIEATIQATKGSYKEHPQDGVEIEKYLNSAGQEQTIARDIIIQLKADKYKVNNPIVEFDADGKLQIEPNATL